MLLIHLTFGRSGRYPQTRAPSQIGNCGFHFRFQHSVRLSLSPDDEAKERATIESRGNTTTKLGQTELTLVNGGVHFLGRRGIREDAYRPARGLSRGSANGSHREQSRAAAFDNTFSMIRRQYRRATLQRTPAPCSLINASIPDHSMPPIGIDSRHSPPASSNCLLFVHRCVVELSVRKNSAFPRDLITDE